MGFRNIRHLVQEQVDNGRSLTSNFRKFPTTTTQALQWYDLSMSPGNPVPNYYASSPLEAALFDSFKGIFHGDDVPSGSKFVKDFKIVMNAVVRGQNVVADYIMFYPFIDGDSSDEQVMTNNVEMPRYNDGNGVLPVLICVAPTGGGGSFQMNYINQNGEAKTTPVCFLNTVALAIGAVATSEQATTASACLYIPLASGDTGVRLVTSFTMLTTSGGGLFSLVLVKPLFVAQAHLAGYTTEIDFIRQKTPMPEILNGAYLNMFVQPNGSVANTTFVGTMTTVWSK